jgi:arabinose-5-phosphate isomerase
MHTATALPRVTLKAPLAMVLEEMSATGLGVTAVVDAVGRLHGVITDGDLRRYTLRPHQTTAVKARDLMTT